MTDCHLSSKSCVSAKRSQHLRLSFLILTAARSGEVFGLRWQEIDLEAGVWTVPADRMKAGRLHRVPLSTQAMRILAGIRQDQSPSDFVFFGQKKGSDLSSMALEMMLRRMGVTDATVHGVQVELP